MEGQVAVVTGGGRGIGRGIALTLAKAGADIAIIETDVLDTAFNQYRSRQIGGLSHGRKTAEEISSLGRRTIVAQADVSKWVQVRAAVGKILDELGRIDILVNNAGVAAPRGIMASSIDVDYMNGGAWDQIMNVNLKGAIFCSMSVLPHMKKRKYGRIINISSDAGVRAHPWGTAYTCSKSALIGYTQSLALDLARNYRDASITANAICPGLIWTDMTRSAAHAYKKIWQSDRECFDQVVSKVIPQGRAPTPEDVGRLALYFAVNPSVTAQAAHVNGGYL